MKVAVGAAVVGVAWVLFRCRPESHVDIYDPRSERPIEHRCIVCGYQAPFSAVLRHSVDTGHGWTPAT